MHPNPMNPMNLNGANTMEKTMNTLNLPTVGRATDARYIDIDLDAIVADVLKSVPATPNQTNNQPTSNAGRARARRTVNKSDAEPTAHQTATSTVEPEPEPTSTDDPDGYIVPDALRLHLQLARAGRAPHLMLIGEPGCGKTEYARYLSRVLGLPLVIADAGLVVEPTDWLARREVRGAETVWHPTPLGDALLAGNPVIVLLDEITRLGPGLATPLLPLLDGRGSVELGGRTYSLPAGSIVVATGNPPRADDKDVRGIGSALQDRFTVVELYPLSGSDLIGLLARYCDRESAQKLAYWSDLCRRSSAVKQYPGTRMLVKVARLIADLKAVGARPADAIQLIAGRWSDVARGGGLSERAEILRLWQGCW
jgi:hypothetical protein